MADDPTADDPPRHRSRVAVRRRIGLAVLGAVLVVGALAWWWPALTRDPKRLDVLVVGDRLVEQSRDDLARRVRQRGLSAEVEVVPGPLCDATAAIDSAAEQRRPSIVVLSFAELGSCDRIAVPGGHRVIVLAQPTVNGGPPATTVSTVAQFAERNGFGLADSSRLLGGGDALRQGCLWWDTPGAGEDRPGLGKCEADGEVTVWAKGALTPAGSERFARVLAADLP